VSTRKTALLLSVSVVVLTGGCARKTAAANPVAHGRQVYAKYCATCHGVAGNGYVADNAPSLRTATFLA
jgi:cytochrome c553